MAYHSVNKFSTLIPLKGDVMTEATLGIEGMSCMHCVMRVKKALSDLTGISSLNVEVGKAELQFDESQITKSDIEAAISKAGYKIKS
jgi:copper chaperone